MVYQTDAKGLAQLLKPSRKPRINKKMENEADMQRSHELQILEKRLASLMAKITELETTNRNIMKRVFELETKVENLREDSTNTKRKGEKLS